MANKEIIVHFGVHKTGTTSIQRTLFNERQSLAAQGILYPTILGKPNHFDLYTYFNQRPLEYRMVRARAITNAEDAEQLKNDIRTSLDSQLAASDAERVILSSEAFSMMNPNEIRQFMSYLASLGFERVRAIVYLRDYVTYWESNLQQAVKGGDYVNFAAEEHELAYVRRYRPLLEGLGASLDRDNVKICLFHRPLLKDGDAVADFFDQLGLGPAPLGARLNESLSKPVMFAINELNRRLTNHATGAGLFPDNVRAAAFDTGGARYYAGPAVIQRILERSRDDRDYLTQHWFSGRDWFAEIIEEVAASPARTSPDAMTPPSSDEILDAIATLVANLQRELTTQSAERWRAVARLAKLQGNEKSAQNALRRYQMMQRRLELADD